MATYNKLCILFCIQTLIGSFATVLADRTILDNMSPKERRQFFGTNDDTVPEFQLINIVPPPRVKRSSEFAFTMHVNISGTILETTLDIIRDEYLISRSTAIWFASSDPNAFKSVKYYPDPTILERIGDFFFYQDVDKGSALTNYNDPKLGHVYTGILCQYYVIKAVPMHYTHDVVVPMPGHAVRMRSVDAEENRNGESSEPKGVVHVIFRIPEDPQEYFRFQNYLKLPTELHTRKRRQSSGSNTLPQAPNVVYPKILVTVDYDSLNGNLTDALVIHLIAHWNSVDMMYRQLSNPAVRLNIVGIVIPTDAAATAYIAADSTNRQKALDARNVIKTMGRDFYSNSRRIAIDSYNIVVAMTRKILCDFVKPRTCETLGGLAMISSACSKSQLQNGHPTAVGGVGIAKFDWIFGGVAFTAHELGHILGVAQHDGHGTSSVCSTDDGYTLVPSNELTKNLRWSSCSKAAFRNYLSSSDASCLRIPPSAIKETLQKMPGTWLSINGQCDNMLNNSQSACNPPNVADICNRYGCMVNGVCQDTNFKPYNGTSCGNGKHCQNGQCSYIQV